VVLLPILGSLLQISSVLLVIQGGNLYFVTKSKVQGTSSLVKFAYLLDEEVSLLFIRKPSVNLSWLARFLSQVDKGRLGKMPDSILRLVL
jgi:hypothetical protein